MALLASVDQLAARVGEPIVSEAEIALATAMLEYASEQALLYGKPTWIADTVPGLVRSIVLEAAARGYMHPAGFEMERADSVTFNVDAEWLRSAEFSDAQIANVKSIAARKGRVRSLSASRPNSYRARSDHGDRRWPHFMSVPYVPEEEVAWPNRLDAFSFNSIEDMEE